MQICIAIPSLSTTGGAERVVCEEAKFFTERGDDVVLLVEDYDPDVTDNYGVPSDVSVLRTDGQLLKDVKRCREVIRTWDIDVVLPHSFTKRIYLATRPFGDQTPYIPHVHGSVLWFVDEVNRIPHRGKQVIEEIIGEVPGHGEFYCTPSDNWKGYTTATVNEFLEARALSAAPRVTTGSNQVRRELAALYDVDASVVRPGVSESWVEQYEDVPYRQLDDHETTILSVSRLDQRKRVNLLIKAVSDLQESGHDVGMVIAGTGPERENLEQLVTERELQDSVIFAGFVPETDLASYYKSADVFACPGWMSYGITPLEAYSMRTPVAISTDAFVNEVLGEEPGTAVLEPTVEAWTQGLPELFDCNPGNMCPSVVPTWSEFGGSVGQIIDRVTN